MEHPSQLPHDTVYNPWFPHNMVHLILWVEIVAMFYVASTLIGPISGVPSILASPYVEVLDLAAVSVPFILSISLIGGIVWYNDDYWFSDMYNTRLSFLPSIMLIMFPIAFVITYNSSIGMYAVGLPLLLLVFVFVALDFKPRLTGPSAVKGGVFWASLVALVMLLLSMPIFFLNQPIQSLLNPLIGLNKRIVFTTILPLYMLTTTTSPSFANSAFMIPILVFTAFVVGFAEEVISRVAIPYISASSDTAPWYGATLANTVFVSLHSIPVTVYIVQNAALLNLTTQDIVESVFANIVILSLLSLFLLYVFAKTGDYVTSAVAHSTYDVLITLGPIIGGVTAALLIITTMRHRSFM